MSGGDAAEIEALGRRFPSLERGLQAEAAAPPAPIPADLARRLSSLGEKKPAAPAPAPRTPAKDPIPGRATAEAEAERLARRLPSLAAGIREGVRAEAAAAPVPENLKARFPNSDFGAKPAPVEKAAATVAALELEAPEGLDGKSPAFAKFREIAGKRGLNKEAAGEVLAIYQEERRAEQAAWDSQLAKWDETLANDPEVGTDDAWDVASSVVKEFGNSKELAELNQFGVGRHPGFARLMYRIGLALQEARGR